MEVYGFKYSIKLVGLPIVRKVGIIKRKQPKARIFKSFSQRSFFKFHKINI